MTTTKLKPDWTGDALLSRLVNLAIQTPALYALMKRQARRVLIKTAEKNGVPWRQTCLDLDTPALRQRGEALTNGALAARPGSKTSPASSRRCANVVQLKCLVQRSAGLSSPRTL